MNSETKKLFDLQSDILSNHILLKMLQFFANEKKEMYLYDTRIPPKEITKRELIQKEETVPQTFVYSVKMTVHRPIISFTLEKDGFTPIEFYNVKLTQQKPTVSFLSSITQILIKYCRPRPSKIDQRFMELYQKSLPYFRHYGLHAIWNEGQYPKLPKEKETTSKLIEQEKQLIMLTSELKKEYQAFANHSAYLNADKTYEISTSFSKTRGISLRFNCIFGAYSERKLIPLEQFHPTSTIFKKNTFIAKEIIECVIPYLNKH